VHICVRACVNYLKNFKVASSYTNLRSSRIPWTNSGHFTIELWKKRTKNAKQKREEGQMHFGNSVDSSSKWAKNATTKSPVPVPVLVPDFGGSVEKDWSGDDGANGRQRERENAWHWWSFVISRCLWGFFGLRRRIALAFAARAFFLRSKVKLGGMRCTKDVSPDMNSQERGNCGPIGKEVAEGRIVDLTNPQPCTSGAAAKVDT
jgi:hypothetical protein